MTKRSALKRKANEGVTAPSPHRARRLSGHRRIQWISDNAVDLFAEAGIDAPTCTLARRLGVTRALLDRWRRVVSCHLTPS